MRQSVVWLSCRATWPPRPMSALTAEFGTTSFRSTGLSLLPEKSCVRCRIMVMQSLRLRMVPPIMTMRSVVPGKNDCPVETWSWHRVRSSMWAIVEPCLPMIAPAMWFGTSILQKQGPETCRVSPFGAWRCLCRPRSSVSVVCTPSPCLTPRRCRCCPSSSWRRVMAPGATGTACTRGAAIMPAWKQPCPQTASWGGSCIA
mmetsp:Transcript_55063/g.171014  ORF Transcript_55063/g.171014 Transcript_55063/m.171014 type:complete len:201 (-) Transcript_55063:118-720(-)